MTFGCEVDADWIPDADDGWSVAGLLPSFLTKELISLVAALDRWRTDGLESGLGGAALSSASDWEVESSRK